MSNQKKKAPWDCEIDISGLCVSERLKELRLEHKLTQENVAKVMNISRREYWRFEQKNYCTRYLNLLVLSVFYNVSMDYLFGLTNEKREVYNAEEYKGNFAVPGLMGMNLIIPNVEIYKRDLASKKAVEKI